jgi:hypothetical protein
MAQCNYGVCLTNGEGVSVDLISAAKYYKLAADQNDAMAQFNYGVFPVWAVTIQTGGPAPAHFVTGCIDAVRIVITLGAASGEKLGEFHYQVASPAGESLGSPVPFDLTPAPEAKSVQLTLVNFLMGDEPLFHTLEDDVMTLTATGLKTGDFQQLVNSVAFHYRGGPGALTVPDGATRGRDEIHNQS